MAIQNWCRLPKNYIKIVLGLVLLIFVVCTVYYNRSDPTTLLGDYINEVPIKSRPNQIGSNEKSNSTIQLQSPNVMDSGEFLLSEPPELFFSTDSDQWADRWLTVSNELWVFSAYYDNRPPIKNDVKIVGTGLRKPRLTKSEEYACFGSFNVLEELVPMKLVIEYIEQNHLGRPTGALLVHCQVPEGVVSPSSVIVVTKNITVDLIDKSTLIRVHRRKISLQDVKRKMAVCVRPSFGFAQNISRVAEWLAVWKLVGATHFSFYDAKMDHQLASFFRYLRFRGNVSVDLIAWKLRPKQTTTWAYGQMEFSSDCVFRHAYDYELVAVLDFDEILMPVQDQDLWELLERKELQGQFSSYCFLQMLMCPPTGGGKKDDFLTQTWLTRDTKTMGCGGLSKYIVRPPRSRIPSIHSEMAPLPPFKAKTVPRELGVSHHYRSRPKCDQKFKADYALRYGAQLNNSNILLYYNEFMEKIK